MKCTRTEYLEFFNTWLTREFPRNSNLIRNTLILREAQKIVDSDNEAAFWGDRTCWQMYDRANELVAARAIEGVTA